MENKEVQNARKKSVVQALISKIKQDNIDSTIKTDLIEGFRKPEKIIRKDTDMNGYVPDVVSEMDGRIDLYEIELHEKNYLLDKWRLFSLYSKKSKGSFNIITPKTNLDKLKDVLDMNKIHANIIYYT